MRERTATLIGLALLVGLLLGVGHLATEGALFSRGFHEWRIDIAADGPEDWRVDVPILVAHNGSAEADLARLLDDLRVTRGNATLDLDTRVVHVEGSGDVTLLARRDFWAMTPAGFGDWRAAGGNATRIDFHPPGEVYVTWNIVYAAGGGHACGGEGVWRATLGPGEHVRLVKVAVLPEGEREVELGPHLRPLDIWCN